jgi:catechol 2,3-dioxygenase-like lactoylglutathione lyase family enzyme
MLNDSKVTANVPVSDLDRARRFYADTLGLTPADENPGGLIYSRRNDVLPLPDRVRRPGRPHDRPVARQQRR